MNTLALNIHRLAQLKWAAAGVICFGVFLSTYFLCDEQGIAYRYWIRYVAYLERKLRSMFIWTSGNSIAIGQLVSIFGLFALWLIVDLPYWYAFAAVVAFTPAFYIERMRKQRVLQIEEQLDGFITALANALKSTPSIGDAFISVQRFTGPPMQQELELAIKEMHVGSTLEQALLLMGSRIGSRQLDSAFSAILIGRQIGGNMPKILETTAATIREMARLEGVIRTKTAEGKAQMWVLAFFPVAIVLAFNAVKEGYFDPLTTSFVGNICIAISAVLWVASIITARKVLNVDI